MRPFKKHITGTVLSVIMFCLFCGVGWAEDANVSYTGNSGDFIFSPGSDYSLTDLFPDFKDVMPGDTIKQKITVRNNADKKVKVKIYLRSLGSTDDQYIDFLNEMKLTVSKVGETPMFEAQANETAGLTDWVCLGTLYSGGEVDLNALLEVPITMDNAFQKQLGAIKWQFKVEEYPIEPTDPSPYTGLTGKNKPVIPLLLILMVCFSCCIALLIRQKNKKKRGQHHEA